MALRVNKSAGARLGRFQRTAFPERKVVNAVPRTGPRPQDAAGEFEGTSQKLGMSWLCTITLTSGKALPDYQTLSDVFPGMPKASVHRR